MKSINQEYIKYDTDVSTGVGNLAWPDYPQLLRGCPKITCTTLYQREDGVVPFTMKICLLDLDFFELLIGHLNSFWMNVSQR